MRKNKMMRAASALLVAVLLTTSTISGTFAKYVTTASGTDTARVAKWGVQVNMAGFADEAYDLFTNVYAADSTTGITNTVEAAQDVVAPGTKNANGVEFSLTGIPEVAVKVEFDIFKSSADKSVAPVEVLLPAGTYQDYTNSTTLEYVTTTVAYNPVVFTLKDGSDIIAKGTLAEIEAEINNRLKNDSNPGDAIVGEYAPGTDLSKILGGTTGEYTLTWEWVFSQGDLYDKLDTYLGNVAAGTVTDANAITNIDFAIAITATQID